MTHAAPWRWDTSLNQGVHVVQVWQTIVDPSTYGWTDLGQKLRRATDIWTEDGLFAFVVARGEPGEVYPIGAVRVIASERDGIWAGWTNPWVMLDGKEVSASIELSTTRCTDDKLQRVLAHELGHVLGLGHSVNTKSLMHSPTGSLRPDEHDLEVLRQKYGGPYGLG